LQESVPGVAVAYRSRQLAGLALLALAFTGCASLPPGREPDPKDPFERYNRAAFSFNDALDRAILKPVARAYKFVTPDLVQQGVANFFGNIGDIPTAVNDILQGKPKQAVTHVGRFALNTTVGVLGLFDVASAMGLERRREDFGQTLGTWGLGSGPYVVLPVFGPSSVRDTFGLVADFGLDPLVYVRDDGWRYGLVGLRAIEQRASVLDIEKTFKAIEIDPYLFTRDAYLTRRRNSVYDGNPPDLPPEPQPPADSASAPPAAD
jgi:phospholipid-binding lipoprotein MlaA